MALLASQVFGVNLSIAESLAPVWLGDVVTSVTWYHGRGHNASPPPNVVSRPFPQEESYARIYAKCLLLLADLNHWSVSTNLEKFPHFKFCNYPLRCSHVVTCGRRASRQTEAKGEYL
jgi:hypothetical protein